MEPLTLKRVATATGGRLVGGQADQVVRHLAIDSRLVKPGDLFVCLKGGRVDGHAFAGKALQAGATAVLADKNLQDLAPVVRVDDTLSALGALGHAARQESRALFVGITGTNGKTSTKDLTAAALGVRLDTVAALRSYNNALGVPLTLLDAGPETQAVVAELGTSAPGEIARLAALVEPEIAVITNVHAGHLEGLRDVAGVREEKGAILDGLTGRKVAVLNRDDASFDALAERAPGPVVSFGLDARADLRARDVGCDEHGTRFVLEDRINVRLAHLGPHAVLNALASLAVATVAEVDLADAAAALASVPPPPGRLQLRRQGGITVIDDSYNANPGSLAAAVRAMSEMDLVGRRVLVVGDMLELGDRAADLHRDAGRGLAAHPPDVLVAIGRHAEHLVEGAVEAGLPAERARVYRRPSSAARALSGQLVPDDVVLVKGSRGMALEGLAKGLGAAATAVS